MAKAFGADASLQPLHSANIRANMRKLARLRLIKRVSGTILDFLGKISSSEAAAFDSLVKALV
jgi:hypothetical protein